MRKPCRQTSLLLKRKNIAETDYSTVNPIALESAIAPHLAAKKIQQHLSLEEINKLIFCSLKTKADIYFVEGIGGLFVPLNEQHSQIDLIKALQIPVILVVGLKLGCLNHALLTYHRLLQEQIPITGWIANCIDPMMEALTENISYLHYAIKAPLIGTVPYQACPEDYLNIQLF